MKEKFNIFYSWQTDSHGCKNYIRKAIDEACKQIEQECKIRISVESDSRGNDGSVTIDNIILKKITLCDFFIADITPVASINGITGIIKAIPNPNVMYELGYASSVLGWNRCVLVWNEEFGRLHDAPFDIRNRLIVSYRKEVARLDLKKILREKILKYDELLSEQRIVAERSFDVERFVMNNQICSELDLLTSIEDFLNNEVYSRQDFTQWSNRVSFYRSRPEYRYVDEALHRLYSYFINNLEEMLLFAAQYNIEMTTNKSEEDPNKWRYMVMKPYHYLDSDVAREMEKEINMKFRNISQNILVSYYAFRDKIRLSLLI